MIFLIPAICGLILGVILYNIANRGKYNSKLEGTGIIAIVVFAAITLVLLFCCSAAYFGSLSAYAELTAAQRIVPEYEKAIGQTADAVVRFEDSGRLIDAGQGLANLRHSTNTSERIEEMRNYLALYYEKLEKWRMWNSKWFIRRFIAPMPKELLE